MSTSAAVVVRNRQSRFLTNSPHSRSVDPLVRFHLIGPWQNLAGWSMARGFHIVYDDACGPRAIFPVSLL